MCDQSDAAAVAATRPRAAARLPAINGLRGIAIAGVLSFHLIAGMFAQQQVSPVLSVLLTNGWSGVALFFVLSGFVLFLPYAADDRTMLASDGRRDFYRRRCRRLLPLFYVGAIGTWVLGIALGGMSPDFGQLLSVLSFTYAVSPGSFGPQFNVPLWSLGDEIVFSALFPLLVVAFRKHGAVRVTAGAAILALMFRLGGIWHFPALQGPTFNSDMFACRIDEFVLGMALARAYVTGWLPRRPGLWALAGVVLVIAAWTGFDLVLRGSLPPICRAVLNDVLDAGLAAIVLAAVAPASSVSTALSWRPLRAAGIMCYSLYIWHEPLLSVIVPDRGAMSAPALAAGIAAFLAATLGLATLSYHLIEFPRPDLWRRLLSRWSASPRGVPSQLV